MSRIKALMLCGVFAAGVLCGAFVTAHDGVSAQQGVEEVPLTISGGASAFGTVFADRVVTNQVIVRDVDIVKLQENLLNVLGRTSLVSKTELQGAIDQARVKPVRPKKAE